MDRKRLIALGAVLVGAALLVYVGSGGLDRKTAPPPANPVAQEAAPVQADANAASIDPVVDAGPALAVEAEAPVDAGHRGRFWGALLTPSGYAEDAVDVRAAHIEREVLATYPERPYMARGGAYEVRGLPLGQYALAGFTRDAMALAASFLSRRTSDREVDLVLRAAKPLAGHVVDTAGAPVPGAALRPVSWAHDAVPEQVQQYLARTTEADGAFRWDLLPLGGWSVEVRAEGYAPLLSPPLEAGREDVVLVLAKGVAVSGRVVYRGSRAPAEDIEVVARPIAKGVQLSAARSGADGAFTFHNLLPAGHYLTVQDDYVALAGSDVYVALEAGADVRGLELEVVPGGTVSGTFRDLNSATGIPGIKVGAWLDAVSEPVRLATTDAQGAYELRGLQPGTYIIRPWDIGEYRTAGTARREVTVAAEAQCTGIDFTLTAGGGLAVSGIVVDAQGRGVAGARVTASVRQGLQYAQLTAQADDGGRFEVTGFQEGDVFELRAVAGDAESESMGPYSVGPVEGHSAPGQGAPVEMRVVHPLKPSEMDGFRIVVQPVAEGLVGGQVVNQRGQPLVGALSARAEDGKPQGAGTQTDASGGFVMRLATPGAYEFSFSPVLEGGRDGMGATVGRVALAAGESRTGLVLVYDEEAQGLSIAGRVADSNGRPLAQITVSASRNGGVINDTTDTAGAFLLRGLPAGVYTVQAFADGYQTATHEGVRAGTEGLNIVLYPLPAIEGQVVDAQSGEPIEQFELAATIRRAEQRRFTGANYVPYADPEGRFRVHGSVEENNVLLARAPGYEERMVELGPLADGRDRSGIRIALEYGGTAVEGTVVDSAGKPVAGASVAGGAPSSPAAGAAAVTGADGRFRINALPQGTNTVVARHPAYAPGMASVNPEIRGIQEVQIVLEPGGVIEGTVMERGQPAAGVMISISPRIVDSVASDNRGRFRIEGLPSGEYVVRARYYDPATAPGGAGVLERPAIVASGRVTEIHFSL